MRPVLAASAAGIAMMEIDLEADLMSASRAADERISPLSPSKSAPVLPPIRQVRLTAPTQLRPTTEVRVSRLERQLRPPSRGLSVPVRRANEEAQAHLDKLLAIELATNQAGAGRDRGGSRLGSASASVLPPLGSGPGGAGARGRVVDEVGVLLKECARVWNSADLQGRPPPQKEAPKEAPPKKAARAGGQSRRRREGGAGGGAPMASSSASEGVPADARVIGTRSAATLYVRSMLSELRSDPEKRQAFEAKVSAIEMARPPPSHEAIKKNRAAVTVPSGEYAESERQRAASRAAREIDRRSRALEQRALVDEARLVAVSARADRWAREHAERVQREAMADAVRRRFGWALCVFLGARTRHLGEAIVRKRQLRIELGEKIASSKARQPPQPAAAASCNRQPLLPAATSSRCRRCCRAASALQRVLAPSPARCWRTLWSLPPAPLRQLPPAPRPPPATFARALRLCSRATAGADGDVAHVYLPEATQGAA